MTVDGQRSLGRLVAWTGGAAGEMSVGTAAINCRLPCAGVPTYAGAGSSDRIQQQVPDADGASLT